MKLLKVSALCAAAVIALAGCNKNEVVNNLIPSDMETAYAKVKISMAGATGTRSTEDEGYDKGSASEAEVQTLTVLLFDESGAVVGVGSTDEFTGSEEQTDYTKYTTGTITVTLDPGSAKPVKLLALVNSDETAFESLDEAVAALTSVTNTDGKKFVMTNSLGNDYKIATDVDFEKNFASTEAGVEDKESIEIFVERLAAKITVDDKSTEKTSSVKFFDIDGKEYKIVFTPHRWAATGTAREMYAFKKGTSFPDWAEYSEYRTNWAEGAYYELPYEKYVGNNTNLRYLTANQVISDASTLSSELDGKTPFYVNEHTFGEDAMDNGAYAPKITGTNAIIVGKYEVLDSEDKHATKFDVKAKELDVETTVSDFYVALRGSQYTIYNKADLITYLVGNVKVASDAAGANEIAREDLEEYFDLAAKKLNGKYVLDLKKDVYYSTDGETWNQVENAATTFGSSNSKHYKFGWAYFLAPIEHHYVAGVDDSTLGAYGVVRNHSYVLTINSITGLGAPLDEGKIGEDPRNTKPDPEDDPDYPKDPDDPDPEDPGDDPIIPDPDDVKTAYIDATLNILWWHIISQDVDL